MQWNDDGLFPDAAALAGLSADFPAREVAVGEGAVVSVRERGPASAPVLVCLHGIGSGAASWLSVARLLSPQARVIAWDAPGYGGSSPLPPQAPLAVDYAHRLHALLDAMGLERATLVGHSLGALVAAAAASKAMPRASRFERLVLVSPARGYGAPGREAQQAKVLAERLGTLDALGIAGMAAQRAGRLVSAGADEDARRWVRWNMARLNDGGYRQAVRLLCGDDLLSHLPALPPVQVWCGALDAVTPPAACDEVARAAGTGLRPIADAGHACYAEQPAAVAALLREVLATAPH